MRGYHCRRIKGRGEEKYTAIHAHGGSGTEPRKRHRLASNYPSEGV